jgi:hypothetical protein
LEEEYDAKHSDYKPYSVFRMAIAGKALPDEVARITQALIEKQTAAWRDAADDRAIRDLQREYEIGMECAGYVQQAFIYAFAKPYDLRMIQLQASPISFPEKTGKSWGLRDSVLNENLGALDKKFFMEVGYPNAQPGDLFVLGKRPDEHDIHTMIVVDYTVSGSEHTWVVDASWGSDAWGPALAERLEGVARRIIKFDDTQPAFNAGNPDNTGKWWIVHPDDPAKRLAGPALNDGGLLSFMVSLPC